MLNLSVMQPSHCSFRSEQMHAMPQTTGHENSGRPKSCRLHGVEWDEMR